MLNKIPRSIRIVLIIVGLIVLAGIVYNIPFVNDKLAWRVDEFRGQMIAIFRPPSAAVFVPGGLKTPQAGMRTGTLPPPQVQVTSITHTPEVTATPLGPTSTPTITPTPLPASVTLPGVKYIDQTGGYNLCGPSNLAMALKFWKWPGTRDDILWAIKPGSNDAGVEFYKRGKSDKNVMPYEMVDFVNDQTKLHAISRYGGNLDLLKRFIAAGYPMLIEKGEFQRDVNGIVSWMGHYQFITGYNDTTQTFLVQDTYIDGPNFKVSYEKLGTEWRAFNYIFMVVYPVDHEEQVNQLLGNWQDEKWANQNALDIANAEIKTLSGLDLYFAWFNKGTSLNQLLQYQDASSAFDETFVLYPNLPLEKNQLPYRMMWYQTGPYRAYFYSGRYQDVINLANVTLSTVQDGPTLEESLYWRGMAEEASGDSPSAVADFQRANHLNPMMTVVIQKLESLGLTPETPVK